MAEVVELFPCLEEEEEEEAEEGEEEKDESLYWSSALMPILIDPICTSGCLSFSSDSEESAIAVSDCSDYNTPLADDLSDDTPQAPIFNPFTETLDSPDFRSLDAANDFLDEGELGAAGNRLVSTSGSRSEDFRIVGFGSESDSSEQDGLLAASDRARDDLGRHHSWGLIPTDDERRNSSEGFEWEEVDDRLDDRGVLGMMASIENVDAWSGRGDIVDVQLEQEEAGGEVEEEDFIDTGSNVVWEVLLAMSDHAMTRNNSGSTIEHVEDIPDFEDDREVFINPSDYDFQFGLLDHDNIIRGSPPAAKLVVDALPSVILTEEDVTNNHCSCAVCKDEFSLAERANQLPCFHVYHNGCILPWLGIRNTCPVCRYELPTDDPEYESLKGRI